MSKLIYVIVNSKEKSLLSAHTDERSAILAAVSNVVLKSGEDLSINHQGDRLDVSRNGSVIMSIAPVSLQGGVAA